MMAVDEGGLVQVLPFRPLVSTEADGHGWSLLSLSLCIPWGWCVPVNMVSVVASAGKVSIHCPSLKCPRPFLIH